MLVKDLDALLVALGALHALPPRSKIVVLANDRRLKSFDAVGASQRGEAHLQHEQPSAVDVELSTGPDDEATLLVRVRVRVRVWVRVRVRAPRSTRPGVISSTTPKPC